MDLNRLKNLFFFRRTDSKPDHGVEEVCVFPLPNVVLLPGAILPLHIFEERYKTMTNDLAESRLSLAMSFAKPAVKGGDPMPSLICGAGKMNILENYPDGRKDIFVEGRKRLKIIKFLQKTPYIRALAQHVPDIPFASEDEERALHQELSMLVKRWIFLSPNLQDQFINYVQLFTRPHHLADFIGYYFLPGNEEKQALLETVERGRRVERIIQFVAHRINVMENDGLALSEESDAPSLKNSRIYH